MNTSESDVPAWVPRVRAKLDALATLGAAQPAAGHPAREIELAPPMPRAELEAFERTHGVVLPETFRAFMLHVAARGTGPDYGLVGLTEWALDSLPAVEVVITTVDGGRITAGTGERTPLRRAADLARPFVLTAPWCPVDPEGCPVALPVPPEDNPYDGCLYLAEIGCGYFHLLVVTGPARGAVWTDDTAGDGTLRPEAPDFLDWYEAWLDGEVLGLATRLVDHALERGERAATHDVLVAAMEARRPVAAGAPVDPWRRASEAAFALYTGDRAGAEAALRALEASPADATWAALLRKKVYRAAFERAAGATDLAALCVHPLVEIRRLVAANTHSGAAELAALADDVDPLVRRAVARHRATAPATLGSMLAAAHTRWQRAPGDRDALFELDLLARADGLAPDALDALARFDADPHPLAAYVVRAAARSPRLPPETLARLAAHAHPAVRHAVAVNAATPPALLAALARDEDAAVRAAVAARTDTPEGELTALRSDPREDVRAALAGNEAAPPAVLAALVADRAQAVVHGLTWNAALPPDARALLELHPMFFAPTGPKPAAMIPRPDDAVGDVVDRGEVGHPSFPRELLFERAALGEPLVSWAMGLHPWLTPAHLEVLARDGYGYARSRVAAHPEASVALVSALSHDPTALVRRAAAGNPRIPREDLERVLAEPPPTDGRNFDDARIDAACNPAASPDTLARLADDPMEYVRRSVASNPSTPADVLARLAVDASMQARWGITWNPAAPAALLVRLADDPDEKVARNARWQLARHKIHPQE